LDWVTWPKKLVPRGTITRSSATNGSSSVAVNRSPARFLRVSMASFKRTRTLVPAGKNTL
jgi:hypothetical protein